MVEAAPKTLAAPPMVETNSEKKVAPAPKVLDSSAVKDKAPEKEGTAPEKDCRGADRKARG